MVGEEQCGHPGRQSLKGGKTYTVEFYLSGRWLSGSPIIWKDMALKINLLRILQN
jgi:hypothetical protein